MKETSALLKDATPDEKRVLEGSLLTLYDLNRYYVELFMAKSILQPERQKKSLLLEFPRNETTKVEEKLQLCLYQGLYNGFFHMLFENPYQEELTLFSWGSRLLKAIPNGSGFLFDHVIGPRQRSKIQMHIEWLQEQSGDPSELVDKWTKIMNSIPL